MTGPIEGVTYPLQVAYCGVCSWPCEYCEYNPEYEKCKAWMRDNLTQALQDLYMGKQEVSNGKDGVGGAEGGGDEAEDAEEKSKRQKRGGKGKIKVKKPTETEKQVIKMSRAKRGKKSVTVISGLASHGVDIKSASKVFASKFACGSSVTGDDEIVIQGDVKDDLWDFIPEKWPEIDEDDIEDLGDMKR